MLRHRLAGQQGLARLRSCQGLLQAGGTGTARQRWHWALLAAQRIDAAAAAPGFAADQFKWISWSTGF